MNRPIFPQAGCYSKELDQASNLRDYVLQHGAARYDEHHNITIEIAPKSVETFEDYQQRLAWYRTSQELRVKG